MRYHWTQKDVSSAANKILRLLEKETDPEKIAFYSKAHDAINHFLFDTYAPVGFKPYTLQERIIEATESHLGYSRFVTYIGRFVDALNPLYEDVAFLEDTTAELREEQPMLFDFKRFTHEETLSLVKGFYADFDKELYDIFMKIYDERYKSVKFIPHYRDPKDPTAAETSGFCLYIAGIDKAFISVDECKGLTKVSDLVHEFGHVLRYHMVPSTAYSKENRFVSEVESIFPELVFLYEQGKKIDSFQSSLAAFDTLSAYYEYAADIRLQQIVINAWFDNEYKLDKSAYDRIWEIGKLTKSDVRRSVNTPLEAHGPYIISFGIVLELFNLYKKDREKAMDLYKKIIKHPSLDDEFLRLLMIENELPLFEHVEEEAKIINADLASEYSKRM